MSADVWVERKPCEHCKRSEDRGPDLNVTYNLSRMLREGGFCGWSDLVGQPAPKAGRHVLLVLDNMAKEPERYRAMNPENGWGDYDECLQGRMREWAEQCVKEAEDAIIGGWL